MNKAVEFLIEFFGSLAVLAVVVGTILSVAVIVGLLLRVVLSVAGII